MKKRSLDIPKKPNAIFYFIAWCIIAPFIKIKYNVKYHRMKEKLQEPYVLISNHGNTVDPFLSACAVYPNRLNFVGGYAYAQKRSYGWLFRLAQAIPKFQYQIDLASIKQMIGIVKNGGNLARPNRIPRGIRKYPCHGGIHRPCGMFDGYGVFGRTQRGK
jgi:1-acyl-sn-glycerol-3-phosphate acyltransferase